MVVEGVEVEVAGVEGWSAEEDGLVGMIDLWGIDFGGGRA